MIASEPRAAVLVDIPNTCTMRGDLTADVDLRFVFGEPQHDVEVVFERPALERFIHLAIDLLATPMPDDETDVPSPAVVSPMP
jgi:hypothetical protein